jgi:DNA-directed RNA polymerase specialized sigma subunit
VFYFNNRNNYKTDISSLELEKKVSNIVYDKWPKLVTQKEIAEEINVSPSRVSKLLFDLTSKKNIPLSLK